MIDFTQFSVFGDFVLRLALGAIFIVHGMMKVMRPSMAAAMLKMPLAIALLIGILETAGGVAMVLNTQVRLAALAFSIIMLGAIYYKVVKWKTGFVSMNATGWEFDLLILGSSLLLLTRA